VIGTRGVIVSPASAIGGPLAPANETMYGMVDTDEAADDLGDIMSILFEYVAPMVQSEAVVAEDKVEFGHMPPNTYNDASAEERV
jgi:hypothetical protein